MVIVSVEIFHPDKATSLQTEESKIELAAFKVKEKFLELTQEFVSAIILKKAAVFLGIT
ncbi:MAG: hypothetical protein LBF15_02555 [Candidatus Peribacteria bacterium]|jgi:hypothetical protein|nr:hypothetical protein [Candidatus Peribacteria bacterium]